MCFAQNNFTLTSFTPKSLKYSHGYSELEFDFKLENFPPSFNASSIK